MWRTTYNNPSTFRLPEYTWDRDRQLCEQCKHCIVRESKVALQPTVVMVCRVEPRAGAKYESCWGARADGECGPKGKLFQPKEET
jgi:hypothetical protein